MPLHLSKSDSSRVVLDPPAKWGATNTRGGATLTTLPPIVNWTEASRAGNRAFSFLGRSRLPARSAFGRAQYSDLVDELQSARALSLLRTELTVDEVANRLGYSDSANFTRAFRRWTGKSPVAFRKG